MKKMLTTLATLATLASTADADIARLELGAGVFNQESSGYLSYVDTTMMMKTEGRYDSKEVSSTNAYAWMLIKHPIPVIPNIRVEYASLNDEGLASGTFDGMSSPAPTDTPASFDITEIDIIPYYNLIDNTFWMTLDVGIDLKVMNIDYTISAVPSIVPLPSDFVGYDDTTSLVLPLVYVRGRLEIPATNIGLESDVKYITYAGSTVYDVRAKVDYTFDFIPVIQPAIEIGYRVHKFDLVIDDDKTNLDLEFAGLYFGAMLRF